MASSMISSSMVHKVACLMMVILISSATTKAAVSCNDEVSAVAKCFPFITRGGLVSKECCSGFADLYANANTTPERQSVCKCLETAINAVPYIDAGLLQTLPDKCGLKIPYKFGTSNDCNSLQ